MPKKSLSYLSNEATQQTNSTGITTPILEIEPEDGTMFALLNSVGPGDSTGLPIFADFRNGAGDQLPTDTKLILRVVRPTDDEPVTVSVAESNIAAWNQLSTQEQRNEDNIDSVKTELQGERVNIRDKDTLRVEIESSEQIDWSNSEFYFSRDGVREEPFEG